MIRKYSVCLESLTPLLMHWDNIEWADQMDQWKADPANKKVGKPGDDRSPAYRWVGSVYHDGKSVCLPSDNLARGMMEGGALVPVPGSRSNKTFKSQSQSGMKVDDPFVLLQVNGNTIIPWSAIEALMLEESFSNHMLAARKLGFNLLVKRARIGQQKHIRVRPKFDKWALEFQVSVWDDQITESILRSILEVWGTYKGLGDWRPGSKTPGSYGMFKVSQIKAK